MADVKISALPAATTPLAGTEVLPIVQSGITAKVSVSNLTAGRAVALGATTITGAATISSTLGVTGLTTLGVTGVVFPGSTSGAAAIVVSAEAGTPTITLPIASGTLATLSGTETLANKTLTAPVIASFTNGAASITSPAASGTLLTTTNAASQAEQETASSTAVYVAPGRQQFHPSSAKGWVQADYAGAAVSSYNVTSVTDAGAGNPTINWNVDFSSASYCSVATTVSTPDGSAAGTLITVIGNLSTAGSTSIYSVRLSDYAGTDGNFLMCAVYGDQ